MSDVYEYGENGVTTPHEHSRSASPNKNDPVNFESILQAFLFIQVFSFEFFFAKVSAMKII